MIQTLQDKINGFGSLFRLITPVLLTIIGTLIIGGQTTLKKEIEDLKTHFTNHLMHHQDLEVGYEKRLTSVENTAFTKKEASYMCEKIKDGCPPKWVEKKLTELEKDIKCLEDKIN